MDAVEQLAGEVGTKAACKAMGVSRASLYRRRAAQAAPAMGYKRHPSPPRALSEEERQTVIDILHSERFVDQAHQILSVNPQGTSLRLPISIFRWPSVARREG